MNRSLSIGHLTGLAIGVIAEGLVSRLRAPESRKAAAPPPAPPLVVLPPPPPKEPLPDPEVATLRARVTELEAKLAKSNAPESEPGEIAQGELGAIEGRFGALAAKKLKALKDTDSVPLLNRIIADSKYDSSVRESAKRVVEDLVK